MARPQKQGLDYFPLDVYSDTKIKLIEAEYGLSGFAIIVKLFQKIYRENGYYSEWNDEVALLFAAEIGAGGNVVSELIKSALKRDIFDKELYEKYSILTSRGIQKRYLEATARRKGVKLKSEYLLIKVAPKNENDSKNGVIVDINKINVSNNQQSKKNKIKVNKSKEIAAGSGISLLLYNSERLEITEAEILNFQQVFPELDVRKELVSMRNWLENNPKGRRSLGKTKQFVNNWLYRSKERVENHGTVETVGDTEKRAAGDASFGITI